MFHKIFVGIVLNSLALYVVTRFVPGIEFTGGIKFFIVGGTIMGFVNTFVKPLMKLLALPFVLMTAGLFLFVLNAIMFWLTMQVVNGISISDVAVTITDPFVYLIAGVAFGLVNWGLHLFIHNK